MTSARACSLQSARSSARFRGEGEGQAAAAPPPWTGSLCEEQESPRCWKIKPRRINSDKSIGPITNTTKCIVSIKRFLALS